MNGRFFIGKMRKQIIFDYYNTLFNPKTGLLFYGVLEFLESLIEGKYTLNLITTEVKGRSAQIKSFGLNTYFSKILIVKQKNKSVFNKLIQNPATTLIIGDRFEEEINIGKSIGTRTLLVKPTKENPVKSINEYLNKRWKD